MKNEKLLSLIKMPNLFSRKNIYRKYSLSLYKNQDEGKIVFFEKIKKDFFFQALLKSLKKLSKQEFIQNIAKEDFQQFRATKEDLKKATGISQFINAKMGEYVNQIKQEWKKTHPLWDIYKHDFSSIEFQETEKGIYDVTFELGIWVTRPQEAK